MGKIARFSMVDKRLLHNLEAERISDAASRPIRLTTTIILASDTPNVEKALTTEDVVLKALVVLIVLSTDDNMYSLLSDGFLYASQCI
jgi:hypothetical protein